MPADSQRSCSAKLLVVVIALLACACGLSGADTTIANVARSYSLHGPDQAHGHTKRQLRCHSLLAVDEDAEERGIANNPSVAKVLYKLTPNKQKAAEKLFKRLKLGKNTPSIFTNAKFLKWEKTVAKSFKTNPEAADIVILSPLHSEESKSSTVATV
uniref:RxLR effector protein n=1 Tax=Phytophthora sojae TaxID=67593 RepID=G1FS15_PHYSO|nr:Avh202a1 [Phytophthora sojae]